MSEDVKIAVTPAQQIEIEQRAEALGISSTQYMNMLVQAWLNSGNELVVNVINVEKED